MKKYIINDKAYLEHELLYQATEGTKYADEWERSHWEVVLNWLNNPTHIEAHTSGTTGTPKLCVHSARAVRASAMITSEYFELREGALVFLCLPSTFIAGKMMILRALIHGWQLDWVAPSSMPFHHVKKHYDFTAITPHQCQEAFNQGYDFKFFKHILLGGSSILSRTREQILTTKAKFHLGYAMTETLTHIAMQDIQSSMGINTFKCLGRTSVRLDEHQRIIIHAPHLDQPEVHTNDIGELMDQNTFKVLGRFDQMINTGGIKIFPEVLENKVAHLIHKPFYFKGASDSLMGEKVILMIEDQEWSTTDQALLKTNMEALLGPYERPKEIHFQHEFHRTHNQKIIKR